MSCHHESCPSRRLFFQQMGSAALATLVSRSDVKLEDLPRKRVMVHVLRGGAS